MKSEYSDCVYSEQDINKAFDMGLEWAIHIFEKTIGFTLEGRIQLIEELKKELSEDKEYDNQPKKTLQLIKS